MIQQDLSFYFSSTNFNQFEKVLNAKFITYMQIKYIFSEVIDIFFFFKILKSFKLIVLFLDLKCCVYFIYGLEDNNDL